jgi:hypothetical protein
MTDREREELVERVASAWRPRDLDGDIVAHPAWHDLDDAGRREAFAVATEMRRLEAALDPQGLSGTARAVLARIRAGR